MAVSKVILNGTTLIDATTATAAAENIISPYTAMLADGVMTTGTGSGGGDIVPSAEDNDVIFIDYDGAILYSYTAQEFAQLSALPSNPSHSGLTSQGWNWTLADAKEYVAAVGGLVIGQHYIPSDEKTHIKMVEVSGNPANRRNFYIGIKSSVANNVTVDWGDGTTETIGATTLTEYEHVYSSPGEYEITLQVNDGTVAFGEDDPAISSNNTFFGPNVSNSSPENRYVPAKVRSIFIGTGVTALGRYAFAYCYGLEKVTLPNQALHFFYSPFYYSQIHGLVIPQNSTIGHNLSFGYATSMQYIAVPKTLNVRESYGSLLFAYNSSLKRLYLPSTITSIAGTSSVSYLQACHAMTKIIIPSWVSSIGIRTFYNTKGSFSEYHFLSDEPPVLSSVNAFDNIASDAVIYVPYSEDHSILSAYQNATNWSTYTSKMQEETV